MRNFIHIAARIYFFSSSSPMTSKSFLKALVCRSVYRKWMLLFSLLLLVDFLLEKLANSEAIVHHITSFTKIAFLKLCTCLCLSIFFSCPPAHSEI
ncbi:hypothetical protein NC651_008323 [Populus alba x Populus x berolinensis]|nr:hypothetical protein NC651_008323 [Populus alba x Populus x berolinensis]